MARHAEIAGGGIGGLGLAMMLARRGWSVRVHERAPVIREIGAGISLRNNCIEVLERYGVFERLRPLGTTLTIERHYDRLGRFVQARSLAGAHRTHVVPRQSLVDSLAIAAREAGAEIVTGSSISGADPEGWLIGAEGPRFKADLCVGADGVGSRVRSALGIPAEVGQRPTRVNRFLISRSQQTDADAMREYWSGDRRVGIMPSGPGQSFVYAVVPAGDADGSVMPMDAANWTRAYPPLASLFDALERSSGTQYAYPLVHCLAWSAGRAALLGDAAHAMPPTLGQGAGLTLMNAHVLTEVLARSDDIPAALREWERRIRFLTDTTQRWAVLYDRFTSRWPKILRPLRPTIIRAVGRIKLVNDRMRIADRGLHLAGFIPDRNAGA